MNWYLLLFWGMLKSSRKLSQATVQPLLNQTESNFYLLRQGREAEAIESIPYKHKGSKITHVLNLSNIVSTIDAISC